MIKNLVSPFKAQVLMAVLVSVCIYGCSKVDMPDEVVTAYRKAIQINPGLAEARYNLGMAYHNRTMTDEAIAELKKATEINPNYKDALFQLGLIYIEKGLFDDAETALKSVIRLDPNNE